MSDAVNRRTILHDLQQTKTRLQKLNQDERPSKLTNVPSQPTTSPVLPLPQRPPTTAPPTPSTSSTGTSPHDSLFISKQQKVALMQASTQSHGYYVSQPSSYGNLVIPVLPRYNDKGQLSLPMT